MDDGFAEDSLVVDFDSAAAGFASELFDSDEGAPSLAGLSLDEESPDGFDA